MFTLVAFSESIDTAGELTNITPLADQHIRVEGKNIVVPNAVANLAAAYAVGTNLTKARVESPSLRRVLMRDLAKFDVGLNPLYAPGLEAMFTNPMALDASEPLRFQVAEDGTGAVRCTGLIWLSDAPLAPVGGDIYTMRATAAGTSSTYTWVNVPLTLDQTIPAGVYQVVGLAAYAANLIAARLVFVGESQRPGCIGAASPSGGSLDVFRRGNLGTWGEFEHSQPPTLDVLLSGVASGIEVYLDLLKIA